jgi:two-component system CheB/CheR fusion protein
MADEIRSSPEPDGRQPDAEPDRLAQPVDAEQAPRLPFLVVGVGASAGGMEAFGEFLDAMRPDAGMAFVFVLHLPPTGESLLAEILAHRTGMPVRQAEDGMPVEPDHVYVIRPGHVLTVRHGRLRLGPRLGSPNVANRPVDDLFRSLAEEQRERAICVVLSGMGSNGTAGAQAVKAVGGLCIAQDPESAQYASMPRHLIDAGYADYVLRPAEVPEVLLTYAGSPYATGEREANAQAILEREGQHLREVLAVLRTRLRQDFNGYKKPTILRRVQRRMGLARVGGVGEYARLLRQTPAEVTALADDLLIHVTGFFRDPDMWEALREKVVAPLVAAREPGAPVRAWVAACSSGEEAYSLIMLLIEESDRAGKRLDIKVFATDLAERALGHARAGLYPGGIESEVSPDRLLRFFDRVDEMYRVRQEVRDRVVFAPQNILQDPPFSRLDIATCRNLLIYLEPAVQKRVLSLLHFGLREGGFWCWAPARRPAGPTICSNWSISGTASSAGSARPGTGRSTSRAPSRRTTAIGREKRCTPTPGPAPGRRSGSWPVGRSWSRTPRRP